MTANYPFRVPVGEFKDKRVLVTGGTKGIGEAIVRRFTLGGALVATTARSPLPQDQSPAVFVQADIGTADVCLHKDSRALILWQRRARWSQPAHDLM